MSKVSASRFGAAIRPWVRAQVVSCSRPGRRDPERPAVGCGDDLDVDAVVLVLADHHRSALFGPGGDAIGTDDGAVEVEVCEAGRGRTLQGGGQVRWVVGEHGQPFVEVAVGRRDGDMVVAVELSQPGTVQEPAQDQHALFEPPQGAGALAPEMLAVFEQQLREGLSSGPADIERAGVGDWSTREASRYPEPVLRRPVPTRGFSRI